MTDDVREDIEERLSRTLHAHADGSAHVEELLSAATGRGRVLRRRRRLGAVVGTVAGVAAVVVLAAFVGLPVPGGHGESPRPGVAASGSPTPDPHSVPTPPRAKGETTAAGNPDVVASDTRLFHIGPRWTPDGLGNSRWWSYKADEPHESGSEGVTFWAPGDSRDTPSRWRARAEVMAAHNTAALEEAFNTNRHLAGTTTVSGRPAQIYRASAAEEYTNKPGHYVRVLMTWYVRWQAAPGLWMQAGATTLDDAKHIAVATRFDTVYRCVTPVRFPTAPAGISVSICAMRIDRAPSAPDRLTYESSLAFYATQPRGTLSLEFTATRRTPPRGSTPVTVQGRTGHQVVYAHEDGSFTEELYVPGLGGFGEMTADLLKENSRNDLLDMMNDVRILGGPDRITGWTSDPLG
ncbi:MAG: hypothetical protein WCA46_00865 [Actinocatenispora sp.]